MGFNIFLSAHSPYLIFHMITTNSTICDSEGKETINLEVTSSIILALPPTYRQVRNIYNHQKRDAKNQLRSMQCLVTPYILEKKYMIPKSSRCGLGSESSSFSQVEI